MSRIVCLLKRYAVPLAAIACLGFTPACGGNIVVGRAEPHVKAQKPADVVTPPQPVEKNIAVPPLAETKKAEPEKPKPEESKPEAIKPEEPKPVSAAPAQEVKPEKEAEAEAGTVQEPPPGPPAKPQSSPITEEKPSAALSSSPYKLDLSFGGYGIGIGLLDAPVAVAVDEDENIYVVDQGNNRVQKFDRFGIYQFAWGRQGTGDGEFTDETVSGVRTLRETGEFDFNKPLGILLDTDQTRSLIRVTVVDSLNYRLQRFLLTRNPGDRFPGDSASTSDQYPTNTSDVFLKLTNDKQNPVQHDETLRSKYSDGSRRVILDPIYIRRADRTLFTPFVWGKLGYAEGLLNTPSYIAIGDDGFLYVSDTDNLRVQGFYVTPNNPDTDAVFYRAWGIDISLPFGAGRLNSPTAIAFDNSGFGGFLVLDKLTDGSYNIQRFDRQGQFLGVFAASGDKEGKFKHPVCIAVNPFDNTVFVTDKGRKKIMVYNSKGEFLYEFGGEELVDPRGIAVLRNNYVYVTDAAKNMVYRYVPQ